MASDLPSVVPSEVQIGHLPALYSWYEFAILESMKRERFCYSCEPGHFPAFRLPDMRSQVSEEALRIEGYLPLRTDPFDVKVFITTEHPRKKASEGDIIETPVKIYVPLKTNRRQHFVFNFLEDFKKISKETRKHLKEKIDIVAGTEVNEDPQDFPKAILDGNVAIFLIVMDHPIARWAE